MVTPVASQDRIPAMHPRSYAPDLKPGVEFVDLPEDEARHLTRVLRLRAGDEIRVFDGRGLECQARIEPGPRGRVRVRVLERIEPAPEPMVRVTLAQAVLKGDHMDAVVRDAAMMGVAAVQPIVTARTQVSLAALERGRGVERWRRVAVASIKQCRRAVVPDIHQPRSFGDYLRTASAEDRLCLMLVEPGVAAPAPHERDALQRLPRPSRADVIVGPEGGWTDAEVEAAGSAGCVLLTLGHRTLRADAAPLAAMAVLQFVWRDL
jgi:16S rRNA (uracil1498-N3)-methyltransferase